MNDHEEAEARRWQVAFEHCQAETCCPANTRHRPYCPRRTARLRRLAEVPITMHNEWGERGCLHVLVAVAVILLLAMGISWWVVSS